MSEIKGKVQNAINNSGYPLELHTGKKLEESGEISCWYNEYFFDYDTNQARSIDLYVPFFNSEKKHESEIFFNTQLAIECKRSPDTAWVFFVRDTAILNDYTGQFVDFTQILKKQYHEQHLLWDLDDNLPIHYGPKNMSPAAQNYQVVKVGDEELSEQTKKALKRKDTIFEAVNQITKFICYRIKREEKRSLEGWYSSDNVEPTFEFFFPIIVFDGPMYNGILENEEIKLIETDHIILEHNYQPNYASEPLTFLIDVVKKEKISDLLSILGKDFDMINKHLKKNEHAIKKHALKLHVTEKRVKDSLSI